jgi:hypothetical protein
LIGLCLLFTPATINTEGIASSKTATVILVTKDGGRVFAKLASIRGLQHTLGGIAFASIINLAAIRSFLDAITAVKTSVRINAVFSADDKFDFTLETRKTNGTRTVHATHVILFFKGEGVFIFSHAGKGTEFALAVKAIASIVTKQIASPIVGHCSCGGQQGEQQEQSHDDLKL